MIYSKIALINQTILKYLNKEDDKETVQEFIEVGIKILEADFGFGWLNSPSSEKLELVYKSKNIPFEPRSPRKEGRNYRAIKTGLPYFVSDTKKLPSADYVWPFVASFVIIPLFYKKNVYGTMVLCFKKKENFNEEKKTLSAFLGNSVAQTITIHRLIERERQALALAEKQKETEVSLIQEKLKTEFMTNATHELRTPLAIMKGNVDLALGDGTINSLKSALKEVDEEVGRLANILADLEILTSEKKNNIKKMVDHKPVDLTTLIKNTAKRLQAIAHHKNISIKAEINKGRNLVTLGDEKYLEKLFLNLIKNSITYGKKGGHTNISLIKKKNVIEIKISDDGIGISKNDLPKIFDRFFRADKSHSSGHHSGLGLAIAKWVAETHNGTISVKSILNKGTTFTVALAEHVSHK